MENAKKNGKEDSVKWALSDLDGLFSYIKQREKQQATLFDEQQIGKTAINVNTKDKDKAQSQIEKINSEISKEEK